MIYSSLTRYALKLNEVSCRDQATGARPSYTNQRHLYEMSRASVLEFQSDSVCLISVPKKKKTLEKIISINPVLSMFAGKIFNFPDDKSILYLCCKDF